MPAPLFSIVSKKEILNGDSQLKYIDLKLKNANNTIS